MLIKQSEATAARRTVSFYAVDATDGVTPETTLTLAGADIQVSKNGAAFATGTGTVTEVASGVYVYEFAVAELDTLGALILRVSDAEMRTVVQEHQVLAIDPYTTIPAGVWNAAAASHVTAATFGALVGQVDDINTSVEALENNRGLKNRYISMGTLDDDESTPGFSMEDAESAIITVTGTFDSATVTVETTADPTAVSPVWTTYVDAAGDNPLTAAGEIKVDGPVRAVRCTMSSAGASSDVACSAAIRVYRAG